MQSTAPNNIQQLKSSFKGEILLPGDQAYEGARKIWNAMIDKHPAVIARCSTSSDVVDAVNFARDSGLMLAVRGGGHNIAGSALCDDGIVIDLSKMRQATVDPGNRRVIIEGGATLAELDAATQAHGLATPVGINSTTGMAGLTLGGGFGWLTREYGMTIDNLVAADVVMADGKVLHADANHNADLFWAIRGGGGNFGVVTQFEFKLHAVGPNVLAGLIVFPFPQAKQVFTRYREFVESAPQKLNVWVVLRQAPPLPFLSTDVHGREVVILAVFFAGNPADGETFLPPLRGFGDVLGEHVGSMPYTQWQQAFDPLLTPGARNYWKSHNFAEINNNVLDTM